MSPLLLVLAALGVGAGFGWLAARAAVPPAVAPAAAPVGERATLLAGALAAPAEAVVRVSSLLQEDAVFLEQHDLVPDLVRLREAGEQIQVLVQGLLELNALDAGADPLRLAPTAVDALFAEVVARQRRALHRSLVELVAEPAPELVVRVDPERFARALGLIVGAHLARSPQGALRLSAVRTAAGVELRITGEVGENTAALVSLLDTTPAMRSADAPAHAAFYLARGLVAAHGGALRLDGGAIVVALPLSA